MCADLALGTCGRKRSGRIAVIPKTTATDYWETLHAGVQHAAAKLRYRIFWNAPQSESEYAQQVLMLEDVIRQRVDGIVLAPAHGSVLASAIRHAKAEGIPLVLVDSPAMVKPDEYVAYIGSDEARVGSLAAERIGALLKHGGDIAVLGVSPTVEAAVKRERAFAGVIRASFPGIRIVDVRYGLSDHIRSREIVRDLIAARPTVEALFASDSFGARGAFAALRNFENRKVRLVAVAQEVDIVGYLRAGLIDSLVVQDSYSMGRRSVEILHAVLEGVYPGPKVIETSVALATAENLQSAAIQTLVAKRRV